MPDLDIDNRPLITTQEIFDKPRLFAHERDNSACGLSMAVNYPEPNSKGKFVAKKSHQVVREGLIDLANNKHRAGFNTVTGESDGAGFEIDGGLPTEFFNKKIHQGEYLSPSGEVVTLNAPLKDDQFIAGNFFLPTDAEQTVAAKRLIENSAKKNGLKILGWRNLNADSAVDNSVLSKKALAEKPAIWQAILLPIPNRFETAETVEKTKLNLERAALKTINTIEYRARKKKLAIDTVSLSADSMIFKGMILPQLMGAYFKDLSDPDFIASSTSSHARFATNTKPMWRRAQPCPKKKVKHNGEYNSKPANAAQHKNELDAIQAAHTAKEKPTDEDLWIDVDFEEGESAADFDEDWDDPDFADEAFEEGYPDATGSDSMYFDADAANQTLIRNIPLYEAVMRLMPSRESSDYSDEINAMLRCFLLERAPYDGPAFLISNDAGYYFAKLDTCALRPGRWGVTQDKDGKKRLYAASEDRLAAPEGGAILNSGNLEAGGMIMLTPEGELLHTEAILELISQRYQKDDPEHFQKLLAKSLTPLKPKIAIEYPELFAKPEPIGPKFEPLNRILYAKGWDYEAIEQVLRHMADYGTERVGSMGDDTNILHSTAMPSHLAFFFHQLFAQVSSPPQDSVNEPENFTIATTLGPALNTIFENEHNSKQIALDSPILGMDDLHYVANNPDVRAFHLDISYKLDPKNTDQAAQMQEAIKRLLATAEEYARTPGGGILILNDKNAEESGRIAIPDLIAVAAVRKHLENKKLIRNVSIVADSYQINGPHHSAALLALGANAVYARGAYAKINQLYENEAQEKANNYRIATEKCLMKTMGKMGIPNVNNYINGKFVAALGIDLSDPDAYALEEQPTLANIFPTIYSPLRGVNLSHIANAVVIRHQEAENLDNDFTLMPHAGHFMPEKGGIKHGYGPVVVNAFTEWMKQEEINETLWRIHTILEKRGHKNFLTANQLAYFTPENGFLDQSHKENNRYPVDYLEKFKASKSFKEMLKKLDMYRVENPTSIRSHFQINKELSPAALRKLLGLPEIPIRELQSTKEIRSLLHAGNMSLGALTEPAHRTLRRGMKAVGAYDAAGEGGEDPDNLRDEFESTRSKQIASGRFGVSAMQILMADEIEIKIAQGAKPGEGGQLPWKKVTVEIAALRGGLPLTNIISPPPHHDIYSIEDLEQLIHDIKSVKSSVKVAVKLVASEGIGTIAVGVAKAGADIISVASNDGGTGAAQQSSIKHTGMPSEIGIAEVDRALRQTKLRDLVELRMSGGFKTAEDIILAAICGADQYELGTTLMITQNCKKQNTCDRSCQPGVAIDGHLFKGKQINTERYIACLADVVQDRLRELGVSSLQEIRGRTELLELIDPEFKKLYDFSAILDRSSKCGILQLNPNDYQKCPSYNDIKELLNGEDCVILYKNELYFANRCRETLGKVKIPTDKQGHVPKEKQRNIEELIAKFGDAYRLADAQELDLITDVTGNVFLPPPLTEEELAVAKQELQRNTTRPREDALVKVIEDFFANPDNTTFNSEPIELTTEDRSFSARIAGKFAKYLEENPDHKIILNTFGKAGQSYGFVVPKGMTLVHTGGVQDGFGKSGASNIVLKAEPGSTQNKAIAGNAGLYGFKGVANVAGETGHRTGILNEGGEITVEGGGDLMFEFMLSGTGMVLGKVGRGLGASATGGIVFHYNRYDLCEYKEGSPIEKNKLYIQIQGDSIIYTVADPKNSKKRLTGVMNIKNLDPDFVGRVTLEKLQPHLAKILAITAAKGHIPKNHSSAVRSAQGPEAKAYEAAIRKMLQNHVDRTQSVKAQEILNTFDLAHFNILLPKAMDGVQTLKRVINVIQTYRKRDAAVTLGEQVWLEQKTLEILRKANEELASKEVHREDKQAIKDKKNELAYLLLLEKSELLFSEPLRQDYLEKTLTSLESIIDVLSLNHENETKMTLESSRWLEQKALQFLQGKKTIDTWSIQLTYLFFLETTSNPVSIAIREHLLEKITQSSIDSVVELFSLFQKQNTTIAPELRDTLARKIVERVENKFASIPSSPCGLLKIDEGEILGDKPSFAEIGDSIPHNSLIVYQGQLFYANKITQTLNPVHIPEEKQEAIKKLMASESDSQLTDPEVLALISMLAIEPTPYEKEELIKLAQLLRQPNFTPFAPNIIGKLLTMISPLEKEKLDFDLKLEHLKQKASKETRSSETSSTSSGGSVTRHTPVEKRLSGINGILDHLLEDILDNITSLAGELHNKSTGCSNCRAGSCQGGEQVSTGCASGKRIPTINDTLQKVGTRPVDGPLTKEQWAYIREAFEVQIEESPFIAYTGAACPAPCQSACTETLPNKGGPIDIRGGKLLGDYVRIKDIEYDLFQLGRAFGWFSNFSADKKIWTEDEVIQVFGSTQDQKLVANEQDPVSAKRIRYEAALKRKQQSYDVAVEKFKPPFREPEKKIPGKKLVIIGSGPAAQQMAFEALRDGLEVVMYEKSDKAGGLITDGIPAHKFDKTYIKEYFHYLEKMGLKLHLNSEVNFDAQKKRFTVNGQPIAEGNDPNTHVALCIGAGKPKELPKEVVKLPEVAESDSEADKTKKNAIIANTKQRIVPATNLLKKFNDIAAILQDDEEFTQRFKSNLDGIVKRSGINPNELNRLMEKDSKAIAKLIRTDTTLNNAFTAFQDILAEEILQGEDPRGKKIVVIGGGDTAQDVIRWLARYFTLGSLTQEPGHLTIVVRGPKPSEERGIQDSWPEQSQTPTAEYYLKEEELKEVDGNNQYLVEPKDIHFDETTQKLSVQLKQHQFKCAEAIENKPELKTLYDSLPRSQRPTEDPIDLPTISDVDMVITATGFQGKESLPIVQALSEVELTNISYAGDAATGAKLIVTAQNSGHMTYENMIKPSLSIDRPVSVSKPLKPTADLSALAANSLFAANASKKRTPSAIMLPEEQVDQGPEKKLRAVSA